MNIQLDSNFKLSSDAYQYILMRKYKNSWQCWGYFTKLENSLLEYIQVSLKLSDSKSIDELIQTHKSLLQSVKEAVRPLSVEVKEALLK